MDGVTKTSLKRDRNAKKADTVKRDGTQKTRTGNPPSNTAPPPKDSMYSPAPRRRHTITCIIFAFSMVIILVSFVSVMFPALFLASDPVTVPGIGSIAPDPYELGAWSGGATASSIVILAMLLLYLTGRLPGTILSAIKRLFVFEISKKVAIVCMILLLATYVAATIPEMSVEEQWDDYQDVKKRLETWSPDQITSSFEPHVRYLLISASMEIFGSYNTIPFLASIALLITTYLTTVAITQKRFAGIVATIILMQSSVFLTYDTSVAYTNFWILLYLVSLYLACSSRVWPFSPLVYLLSIPSKALTAVFAPMSVYFILNSSMPRKHKTIIASATALIVLTGGVALLGGGDPTSAAGEAAQESFDVKEFLMGFSSFASQMRFDALVMLFMIPLIVGLFMMSRYGGIRHSESIMVLIAGMLLIAPLLTGFTNQTNQPYRFVPLVVFFAIGVGMLLSKKANKI